MGGHKGLIRKVKDYKKGLFNPSQSIQNNILVPMPNVTDENLCLFSVRHPQQFSVHDSWASTNTQHNQTPGPPRPKFSALPPLRLHLRDQRAGQPLPPHHPCFFPLYGCRNSRRVALTSFLPLTQTISIVQTLKHWQKRMCQENVKMKNVRLATLVNI